MKPLSCLGFLIALAVAGLAACGVGALAVAALLNTGILPTPAMPTPAPAVQPAPAVPVVPVTPAPTPDCPGPNCPNPNKPQPSPRKPWGPRGDLPVGQVCGSRDGSTHDGHTVQVDLPVDQLVRNCGGSNGAGLCVFTSIMFSARLQNVPQLKDFQTWMKKHPGGGWPQKVDQMIARKCQEEGKPVPDYIQIENGDWDLVKLALKTGRMPAITYGSAHMVNIVCLDGKYGAFRDNNFVAQNEIDWMTEEQAKQKAGGKRFWAVVLLAPRPPMPPKNTKDSNKPACCAAPYVAGKYRWQRFWECQQWALWRDGVQVGAFDADLDLYGTYNGPDDWGPYYRRPPVDLPSDAMAALGANAPGGVLFNYQGAPRYSRGGAVISREEAIGALSASKLDDDSQKLSLTVIGEQPDIDRVRAELVSPANATFASRVVFQGYTPDDWAVSTQNFGFAHDGKPTIYLQKPDGEVLLHLQKYDATTFQTLRQKDPSYNPNNDPGVKQPNADPTAPDSTSDPLGTFLLWLVGGLGFCVLTSVVAVSGGLALHFGVELLE